MCICKKLKRRLRRLRRSETPVGLVGLNGQFTSRKLAIRFPKLIEHVPSDTEYKSQCTHPRFLEGLPTLFPSPSKKYYEALQQETHRIIIKNQKESYKK